MARRIEQSGRHGPHDRRWTSPVLAVSEIPLPLEEPEEPAIVVPTLKLVGGTDVASTPLDRVALPRA